jgi:hypothetical protein
MAILAASPIPNVNMKTSRLKSPEEFDNKLQRVVGLLPISYDNPKGDP